MFAALLGQWFPVQLQDLHTLVLQDNLVCSIFLCSINLLMCVVAALVVEYPKETSLFVIFFQLVFPQFMYHCTCVFLSHVCNYNDVDIPYTLGKELPQFFSTGTLVKNITCLYHLHIVCCYFTCAYDNNVGQVLCRYIKNWYLFWQAHILNTYILFLIDILQFFVHAISFRKYDIELVI